MTTNANAKAMGREFTGVHQQWQERHKVLMRECLLEGRGDDVLSGRRA